MNLVCCYWVSVTYFLLQTLNPIQVAERLYITGYLSYPRTESSAYPPNFDIQGELFDCLEVCTAPAHIAV